MKEITGGPEGNSFMKITGSKNRAGKMPYIVALTVLVSVAAMVSPAVSGSINDKAGTTGFSFLKLGVGSQAPAMGGAYVALADDPSTLYYNPAGTVYLSGKQFMGGYHNYLMDIQSGFVAVTFPGKEINLPGGNFGLFINYLNYGTFTRTDESGVEKGDFSGGDFLVGANVAFRLPYDLAVGMNAKFMTERAAGWSAEAVGCDLGVMRRFGDSLTTAGASVSNMGGVVSGFSEFHKDRLPIITRVGVSHHPRGLPLLVSLDGVIPNDNDPYVNIGVEVLRLRPLYLRAGYSTYGENYKTGSSGDGLAGFAAGFGLDYRQYHFSYAFVPYLDLGSSHRVTITGEF